MNLLFKWCKTQKIEISIQDIFYIATLPSKLLKEFIFDVYMLSDKTKKIIYIASISVGITQHIVDRLCSKDVTITKIKRIYIWELRKFVEQQDAVLVDMYTFFTRSFRDGFLVPSMVNEVLNINKPIDEAIKLSSHQLKKVDKYNFEISNDLDALKFFYEKMYVTHAKKKYGEFAYVEHFNYLKKILRRGELIFIKLGGEYVSGALCEICNESYLLQNNGVIDESYIKEGALIATYYFPILRAKEINAKIVDFGGSKPFLSDGVLRHKNQWGARICMTEKSHRTFYLKNVLFDQPFIYIDRSKLKIAVLSEDDKLIREYANSGLEFSVI